MLFFFFFFFLFLSLIVVVVDHRNSRVQAHKHWRCLRRLALMAEGRDSAETSRPWKLMTNLHGIEGVVGLMVIWVYGEPEIHGIYIQCPEGSQKVLGTTSYISDDLRRQVRWGQWGVSFFGFAASIFYFAGSNSDDIRYVGLALGAIAFMFLSMLYYKNISYAVVCRLFREENVVVVFLTSLGNLCIDIMQLSTTISPILGLLYLFCVNAFLFLDALKLKSRFFVLFIGSLFVVLTVHNIYGYTCWVGIKMLCYLRTR